MDAKLSGQWEAGAQDAFSVELVWDADLDCTAIPGDSASGCGAPLRVGPAAGWLPAHHLTLAAASSFVSSLLQLARADGVSILGYVSVAKLSVAAGPRLPHVTLNPCIVVGTPADAARVSELIAEATESSDVCRLFRGQLLVNPEIRVVEAAAEQEPT